MVMMMRREKKEMSGMMSVMSAIRKVISCAVKLAAMSPITNALSSTGSLMMSGTARIAW